MAESSSSAGRAHGAVAVVWGLVWILVPMIGVALATALLRPPAATADAMLAQWLPVQVLAGLLACAAGGWQARRLGNAQAVTTLMLVVVALGIAEGAVLLSAADPGAQRPWVAAAPVAGALGVWIGGSLRGGLVPLRIQWLALALAGVYASASLARPGASMAPWLKGLAVLGELAVIGTILAAVWRTRGSEGHGADEPLVRIDAVTTRLFGKGRVAEVVATEVALLVHALRPPQGRSTRSPFDLRLDGHVAFVIGFAVVILVEAVALHLFVMRWSPLAAWILTGLSAYGVLWLVGDYRAIRDLPSRIVGDALQLRLGIRWRVTVPLSSVLRVTRMDFAHPEHGSVLQLAPLQDPNVCITFTSSFRASGYYGLRRDVGSAHAAFAVPGDALAMLAGASVTPLQGTRSPGGGSPLDRP